ncbi:uncharacterized protein [Palaemon carinicauda]|uniref:uncharacterized protein n=1 Tax=Palaemon carinicauda TaxID=392227 RepID=UPI0035B641DB
MVGRDEYIKELQPAIVVMLDSKLQGTALLKRPAESLDVLGRRGYDKSYVKTHKNGNTLQPIICQCLMSTYHLAKRLNSLLNPYFPSEYSVASSTGFLSKLKGSPSSGTIASLDVESLYTYIPVRETINLILERVYRDPSNPTLNISEEALRILLEICTRKAPSTTHRGLMYIQKDGVAMGSSLGVLFANFYRGVVEESVSSRICHPDVN